MASTNSIGAWPKMEKTRQMLETRELETLRRICQKTKLDQLRT